MTGSASKATISFVLMVGSLTAFGPLSTDLYLPGFGELARDLHATESQVQLTLTACFVGMGVGQLFAGALSDQFGRRRPLVIGLAGFTVASLLCALAPSITILVVLRALQGLGAAAGLAIARAVVRDLHSGVEAARFFSLLMLVTGLAPILAPVIGAQLLRFSSWRAMFVFLGIVGACLMTVSAARFPETLPPERRRPGGLRVTGRAIRDLSRDKLLIGYALVSGFAAAALLTYIAGSPFVLEDIFHASPQTFSLIFASNAGGLVIVSQANRHLLRRVPPESLLAIGVAATAAAATGLLLVALIGPRSIWAVLPFFFVIVSCVGIVNPNATALAMTRHPDQAGSASAALGLVQFALAGMAAPLAGISGSATAVPLSALLAGFGASAAAALIFLARPGNRESRAHDHIDLGSEELLTTVDGLGGRLGVDLSG